MTKEILQSMLEISEHLNTEEQNKFFKKVIKMMLDEKAKRSEARLKLQRFISSKSKGR